MASMSSFWGRISGKSVVTVNNDAQSTVKTEDTFKPNSVLLVNAANSCDHFFTLNQNAWLNKFLLKFCRAMVIANTPYKNIFP